MGDMIEVFISLCGATFYFALGGVIAFFGGVPVAARAVVIAIWGIVVLGVWISMLVEKRKRRRNIWAYLGPNPITSNHPPLEQVFMVPGYVVFFCGGCIALLPLAILLTPIIMLVVYFTSD